MTKGQACGCWAVLAAVLAAASVSSAETRRLVLVSVDGLRPDYYTKADEIGLKVPTLRRLMREGAYAHGVVGVLPTVTYPSHTSLITGVPPRVHGILGNSIFDPLNRSNGAWEWFADDVRVPSLATAAHAVHLTTAAVSWPVTVGLDADWIMPEFWRPNSSHPYDIRLLKLASTPRLLDDIAVHRGRPMVFPIVEKDRMDAALFILDVHRPELLLLHIFDTDSAQHSKGPLTPEAKVAVEGADANLGRLLAVLEKDGLAGETVFAVVSDHGFMPVTTTLRPNVLLRDAGLLTVDSKGKTTDWRAWFHVNGGSAALRLRDPKDAEALAKVRGLLEAKKAEGVYRILGPEEIARFGGDRDASLAIDASSGLYFNGGLDGPWSEPSSANRGYHGYAPDRPEMLSSFVVAGPGLKKKGDLGTIKMTEIAPTLAQWLGVTLGAEADRPLPLFDPPVL